MRRTSSKYWSMLSMILFLTLLSLAPVSGGTDVSEAEAIAKGEAELGKFLAMALSTGISCAGAGYALGKVGEAAVASITEKPEMFGRTIVFAGLAEGIAIYGLLISFLIWIT